MSGSAPAVWPPYVRSALALALTVGFGVGGALFAAVSLGVPLGAWWPAAAQAHGHAQLFGWAGLMVLGVGFHFLPRLRGAPPLSRGSARLVLLLLLAGIAMRALAQPALALATAAEWRIGFRLGLAASGALELGGATLALALLARTLRSGPPLREHAAMRPVLPFFLAAFGSLWLALAVNALATAGAALAGRVLATGGLHSATLLLALHGFLVPVSVAMSARTFPLYFRTPLPKHAVLRLGLALLLAGLALRVPGELAGVELVDGTGRLLQAAALCAFIAGLGVFAPRRPLPRGPVRPLSDPVGLHAVAAYAWLALAAVLLVLAGPPGTEVHALGAGFVTVLILGMGSHLLPGFARRPLRSRGLVWLTLALGNVAALLRVGPLLLPAPAAIEIASLASAGLVGLLAVAGFGLNVAPALAPPISGPQVDRRLGGRRAT